LRLRSGKHKAGFEEVTEISFASALLKLLATDVSFCQVYELPPILALETR